MLRSFFAAVTTLGLIATAACGSGTDSKFVEGDDKKTDGVKAGPANGIDTTPKPETTGPTTCGKVDILFVIDDSASMRQEQESLIQAFPQFLDAIAATNGGTLDYRIAVTTTSSSMVCDEAVDAVGPDDSVAVDGALVNDADCGMTQPWIARSDAKTKETFACAADVGIAGSSDEMPLFTMRSGLEKAKANGQFLRDDALLTVVILSDEDDSSTRSLHYTTIQERNDDHSDVASFGTFLDGVKGGRDRWSAAVIAGEGECESDFGKAHDSPRLHQFAALAGKHGSTSSICAGDLGVSLKDVLATIQAACNDFPSAVK